MSKRKQLDRRLVMGIWFACWVFNTGAIFADLQGDHLSKSFAIASYRSDAAFSIGLAMLGPAALPVSIFGTGFCEHGWRLPFIPEAK